MKYSVCTGSAPKAVAAALRRYDRLAQLALEQRAVAAWVAAADQDDVRAARVARHQEGELGRLVGEDLLDDRLAFVGRDQEEPLVGAAGVVVEPGAGHAQRLARGIAARLRVGDAAGQDAAGLERAYVSYDYPTI